MSQAGDEVDVFLVSAAQIQDRQASLIAERPEELIEAPLGGVSRTSRRSRLETKCGAIPPLAAGPPSAAEREPRRKPFSRSPNSPTSPPAGEPELGVRRARRGCHGRRRGRR